MIKQLPSPNHDSREGHAIDMLVLHYTGMQSAQEAITRLLDPAAKVSAHYLVDEDGSIYALVPEECRAWHAGVSYWRGNTNINQRSIGIEIVNPGHEFGYRPFTEPQMQAVIDLCEEIIMRHHIPVRNVVGHSDVAPARKEDPGEMFDWQRLSEAGVGVWVSSGNEPGITHSNNPACHSPLATPQVALTTYGYDTSDLPKAILAFQRHFRPAKLSGEWDAECAQMLDLLIKTT